MRRYVVLFVVALAGCFDLESVSDGLIHGLVYSAGPIEGAVIEVWRLDDEGRALDARKRIVDMNSVELYQPTATGVSDADGAFQISIGSFPGRNEPFLVTARQGSSSDFWAPMERYALPASPHTEAIVGAWIPGQPRAVTLTPFSSIAAAEARWQARCCKAFRDAVQQVNFDAGDRIDGDSTKRNTDLTAAIPTPKLLEAFNDPNMGRPSQRYFYALQGLASLAAAHANGHSVETMNASAFARALVEDASDGSQDGFRDDGTPILVGESVPLAADTLTVQLAIALVREFGPVAENFTEVATHAGAIAGDAGLDHAPPVVRIDRSEIADESEDVVSFLPDGTPVHANNAGLKKNLADAFDGDCDTEIHKHANRLQSPDDNPLRFVFDVQDDIGVSSMSATITDAAGIPYTVSANILERDRSGGAKAELVLLASDGPVTHPLLKSSGTFSMTVVAKDAFGKASEPVTGCWQYVLRPPPFCLSPQPDSPGHLAELVLPSESHLRRPVPLQTWRITNSTAYDGSVVLGLDSLTVSSSYAWAEYYTLIRAGGAVTDAEQQCLLFNSCVQDELPSQTNPVPHSGVGTGPIDIAINGVIGPGGNYFIHAGETAIIELLLEFLPIWPNGSFGRVEDFSWSFDVNRAVLHGEGMQEVLRCSLPNGNACASVEYYSRSVVLLSAEVVVSGSLFFFAGRDALLPARVVQQNCIDVSAAVELQLSWYFN